MSGPSLGRRFGGLLVLAALTALAACGDKPQTLGGEAQKKSDTKASDGSSRAVFVAPGWKQGDAGSWEQQLKARNQNQNEYTRVQ